MEPQAPSWVLESSESFESSMSSESFSLFRFFTISLFE